MSDGDKASGGERYVRELEGLEDVQTTGLQGFENAGNSCYIDSLVFAMFATTNEFDALIIKEVSERARSSQLILRLLVNQLRRGKLVKGGAVALFRETLRQAGWAPESSADEQEDVSELFLFLAELLCAPFLLLEQEIISDIQESPHGAGASPAVSAQPATARALHLPLPEESKRAGAGAGERQEAPPSGFNLDLSTTGSGSWWNSRAAGTGRGEFEHRSEAWSDPWSFFGPGRRLGGPLESAGAREAVGLSLEALLLQYFFDNRIRVKRELLPLGPDQDQGQGDPEIMGSRGPGAPRLRGSAADPGPAEEKCQGAGAGPGQPGGRQSDMMLYSDVNAWQSFHIAPFYTPENEAGEVMDAYSAQHAALVLPLVLGRYRLDSRLGPQRSAVAVELPLELDFTKFISGATPGATPTGTPTGTPSSAEGAPRFCIWLRSLVCHAGGDSLHAGHYIAYSRHPNGAWLKFDDLDYDCRVRAMPADAMLREASTTAYLLFYEVRSSRPATESH